jgi:hypothetical protein
VIHEAAGGQAPDRAYRLMGLRAADEVTARLLEGR